jgi:hypothetical protein
MEASSSHVIRNLPILILPGDTTGDTNGAVPNEQDAPWMPVVAKSLAILAMHRAELGNSEVSVQADFLEALGLPRTEVARMLGTTAESLRVMSARRKKKGKRRGKTQKD